jgi:hypothetical protein
MIRQIGSQSATSIDQPLRGSESSKEAIIRRWTEERLREAREMSKFAQVKDKNGVIWRAADVVLGKG